MSRTIRYIPRNAELAACEPGALRTRVVGAKRGKGRKGRPRRSNRVVKEQSHG